MSKTNKIKLMSIFLMFVLCIYFVSAYEEKFDAYSALTTINSCAHSVTTNSITVKNTGDTESYYSLSTSGSGVKFTTYSDSSFSLKPGETKEVYMYFATDSNIGDYHVETTVSTKFNNKQVIVHDIHVDNCKNMQLIITSPSLISMPGQLSKFSFFLTNTRDYAETYDVSSSGMDNYVTLSATKLFLAPMETKEIDLFVNPECSIYGEKDIKLDVLAKTSKYQAEANVKLNILRAYDYDVNLVVDKKICNLKQTTLPITIKNNADVYNQYDFAVNGQSWITTSAKKVELQANSQGTINLILSPTNSGIFNFELLTKSARGDLAKLGSYQLNVEDCYDAYVNIDHPKDIIVLNHDVQYPVIIKNEGTMHDNYKIELNGTSWSSINAQDVISLGPNESKTLMLDVNPNETGDYKINVRAISSETNKITDDVIELQVIDSVTAYDLKMSAVKTRVAYNDDYVAIAMQNTGILPANYTLTFNRPEWINANDENIVISPGNKTELIIPTNATNSSVQGDYSFEISAIPAGETTGYLLNTTIKLRKLSQVEEFTVFLKTNYAYILLGLFILIIALLLGVNRKRISNAIRDSKIRRKELARLRAEKKREKEIAKRLAKERKAKQPKEALKEIKQKGKSNIGKILLGILLILIALGLFGFGVMSIVGYAPFVNEFFDNVMKGNQSELFEPMIQANTTGLEAYGNTIVIREPTTIPILVRNSYDDEIIVNVNVDSDFMKTDTEQVQLKKGEQQIINLEVSPNATSNGLYKISINASMQHNDKLYAEHINLNIKSPGLIKDIISYLPYFIAGIILFVLGIIVVSKKKVKKQDKKTEKKKEIKLKPLRKINIEIPKSKR